MKKVKAGRANPLSDLITDDVFELLYCMGFIKDISIKNFNIRKQYGRLRLQGKKPEEAISIIHNDYKFLQKDSLRKIVYWRCEKEIQEELLV